MMIHSHNQYCGDLSERMQKYHSYVHALEQERRKVLLFQRELPLCLEIVTQAIESCKKQLSETTTECNQSNSSDQTSSVLPILEEFIPIKNASTWASDVEREDDVCKNPGNMSYEDVGNCKEETNNNIPNKSDWLRSVGLWNNQTPDPADTHEDPSKTIHVRDVSRGGAFHPFEKEEVNLNTKPSPLSSTSGFSEDRKNNDKMEKEGKSSKRIKTRRCWSPELHKRFLQALKQLGGSHAATPKQIRELMKVDGLTNDEVKSHLQKYRLHTRRPSQPSVAIAADNNPQFVVVGGIWVPPEYSSVAESGESPSLATTSNGV